MEMNAYNSMDQKENKFQFEIGVKKRLFQFISTHNIRYFGHDAEATTWKTNHASDDQREGQKRQTKILFD